MSKTLQVSEVTQTYKHQSSYRDHLLRKLETSDLYDDLRDLIIDEMCAGKMGKENHIPKGLLLLCVVLGVRCAALIREPRVTSVS